MATGEEVRAARDAKLDELHERLASAVERLVSRDDWHRALEFAARFRARSFGNTLLIWVQHLEAFEQGRVPDPEPSYVAGYKQWQTLGRQVAKGQPGYMIFAPVTGRFASSTPQDVASWRRLGRFEKPKAGEAVRSRMIAARPAYVWDVSQTTGDPIPERPAPRLLEGEAPAGLWEGLAALVEADGYRVLSVDHEGVIGGANGLTDFQARTVAVRTNMDPAAQVKTLAHELGHVRLHGPDNPDWAGHRGIGEVEAESVALMIGAAHGMDTSSYSVSYVSGWAGTVKDKDPAEVVQATGERVRKTASALLDALDTMQLGAGDPPGLIRDATPSRAERTPPATIEQARPAADAAVRSL
ncbi:serine/arginine repetitive matrix protein 2 [Microbacterium sp. Gd 4-13]|uniref:ArdC-like ssDNA-binding domain-containing protein n=1 Tax=Microbacterium sp. Gd 4-13 TaxID=2173179 RepID=UPI000D570E10|nr:ArdC-like ssDNA-binding domain-containing protein [Microbacterium sp. Gd 4-13]PVW02353.1 serine/arginine repetitive matrix protein 2 [Microbacterium sp. Gd 4-13]